MKKTILIFGAAAVMSFFANGCLTTGGESGLAEFKERMMTAAEAQKEQAGQASQEERAARAEEPAAAETAEPEATAEETPVPVQPVKAAAKARAAATREPAVAEVKEEKIEAVPEEKVQPAAGTAEPVKAQKKGAGWLLWLLILLLIALVAAIFYYMRRAVKASAGSESKGMTVTPAPPKAPEEPARPKVAGQPVVAVEPEPQPEPEPPKEKEKWSPPATQEEEWMAEAKEAETAAAPAAVPKGHPEEPAAQGVPADTGAGVASISPIRLAASSAAQTISIKFTETESRTDYRTVKVTLPEEFPMPSVNPADEGFFTARVSQGSVMSVMAERMSIIVHVFGLGQGEAVIAYGDRSGNGPGITVPAVKGNIEIKVETEAPGVKELKEIFDSPVVEIV